MIVAYYQRFVDANGEVRQGREEKQLAEVFTRWNDEGELQGGKGLEFLLENCIHDIMGTVLVLVEWVVADESEPLEPRFSRYLVKDVNEVLLRLHAFVVFPCEPECEISEFCERLGCLECKGQSCVETRERELTAAIVRRNSPRSISISNNSRSRNRASMDMKDSTQLLSWNDTRESLRHFNDVN